MVKKHREFIGGLKYGVSIDLYVKSLGAKVLSSSHAMPRFVTRSKAMVTKHIQLRELIAILIGIILRPDETGEG